MASPKLERIVGSGGALGWWTLVAAALILGAKEVRAPSAVLDAPLVQRKFPVEAVRWLAKNPIEGRVFNAYEWGGFLTHELPARKVFIDSRMVPFKAVLEDYLVAQRGGPDALAVLARHGIDWVVIEKKGALARTLAGDARWKLAHEDELAVVFIRRR